MDLHPTPFPGKTQQHVRSKTNKKPSEAQKANAKEPPIHRQNRVFGTTRNPNVPVKIATGKPITKLSSGVVQKPTKTTHTTPSSTEVSAIQETKTAKNTNNGKNARPKKKSVCFQEKVGETKEKIVREEDNIGLQTPVRSPSLVKPRVSGTPYMSAERCSKCRFDKLETSSYWLAQIKLAESVQKHFVSVAFFRLALESKAEPFRNIRVELKRYLARHEHLSADKDWREVSTSYGLIKEDSNIDQENTQAKTNEESDCIHGEEQETKEQVAEETETIKAVDS